MVKKIPTPELDKIAKARDNGSERIGEFLEWMMGEKGFVIAQWESKEGVDNRLHPVYLKITNLISEYYGIDEAKAEKERVQILESIRAKQG